MKGNSKFEKSEEQVNHWPWFLELSHFLCGLYAAYTYFTGEGKIKEGLKYESPLLQLVLFPVASVLRLMAKETTGGSMNKRL